MYKNSNSHYAGTKTKHGKMILSVILSIVMIAGCFGATLTAFAASDIASGNLTDSISWRIDGNGVLRVTGTGAIPDCTFWGGKSSAPWFDYNNKITGIVIGEGITEIGECTFAFFDNPGWEYEKAWNDTSDNWRLTQLSFPSTLKKIDSGAFCETYFDCNLVIPNSVTEIGNGAFQGNYGMFKGHKIGKAHV